MARVVWLFDVGWKYGSHEGGRGGQERLLQDTLGPRGGGRVVADQTDNAFLGHNSPPSPTTPTTSIRFVAQRSKRVLPSPWFSYLALMLVRLFTL